MMVSHGALLSDVYGTDNIKVKKKSKDKKKGKEKDINFFPEREMEKHIFPHQLEKVDVFDHSFHAKSNIMPYGEIMSNDYFNLDESRNNQGRYFPINTHTLEGQKQKQEEEDPPPTQEIPLLPPTAPVKDLSFKRTEPHLPKQPVPWDKGINIPEEEYKEFQEFKKFKAQQKVAMMNEQRERSQNNSNEGFANVNDDFNDVLLFGLLGIFFLIFTDYIYKLGRKSY